MTDHLKWTNMKPYNNGTLVYTINFVTSYTYQKAHFCFSTYYIDTFLPLTSLFFPNFQNYWKYRNNEPSSMNNSVGTDRSIEIIPRGRPPFLGWCWWILEADPPFWGCMLMNSRGGPPFGDCIMMNSRGGPPILKGGLPLGTISVDHMVCPKTHLSTDLWFHHFEILKFWIWSHIKRWIKLSKDQAWFFLNWAKCQQICIPKF